MFTFDSCSPGFTFLKVDGTSDQAFRRLFRHAARGSGSRLRLLRLGCPPDFRREILAKVGASGEENACCLLLQDAIPSVEILLPDPSAEPFLTRMDAESRSPWHMWRIAREVVELVSHLLEIRKQRARPDSLRVGFHQTGLLWNMGIVGDREILFRPYGAKTGHDPSNADFYLSHGAPREVRRAFVSYYERVRSDAKTRFFSSREEFEDLFRSWRWPTLFKGNAVRSRRKDRDKSEHEGALDDSCVYKACCTPASTAAERAIYEGVGRSGGHRYLRVPDIRSIRNVPWRNGCLCIQRIQGCTLFELVSHVQQMGAEGPGKRDQSELILGVIVEQALLALDEFTAAARRLLSGRTATYPYAERMSSALADVVRFCGSITEAEVASGLADLRKLGRELQKSATVPFRDAHLKNRILEHGERSTRTAAEKLFGLSSEALESFLGENTFDIDFEMSNLLVTEWEDPVHLLCFEECGLAKVRDAGELEEFIRSWMPDRRLRPLWEDLFWKTLLARATREHCRRIWYANVMPLSHTKRYLHERRDQFLDLALRAASRISGLLGLKQCLQRFKESPAEMWPRSMRCRRAEPIAAKPPPARAGAWSPCKRPVGRAHPGPLDELLANSGELVESVRALRRQLSEQDGRVEHRFDRLDAAGRRLMKKVKAGYAGLIRTLLDEGMEGPRLFSLEPVEPGFLDHPGWMGEKFRLTLWCEHSRLPLPALNGKGDRRGVYEMTFPREWFVQVAPFLKLLTRTLSLMVPVASSATKLTIGDETYEGILKQLDLGERIADAILKGGEQAASSLGSEAPRIQVGEAIDARGAALRMLQSLLKRKDPTFGGLERVQKKGRECLWVHPQFVKEYRRR